MKYFYTLRNSVTDTIGWVLIELSWLVSSIGYINAADELYTLGRTWYSYYKHPDEFEN